MDAGKGRVCGKFGDDDQCLFVVWGTLYMLEAVVGAAVCVCVRVFWVWCGVTDKAGGMSNNAYHHLSHDPL